MSRLLLIANDIDIARQIETIATMDGVFRTDRVGSVTEAVARGALETIQSDAVLIAVADAADVAPNACARLRQIWSHCPIIVISRATEEATIVASLDAGATDYIAMPLRRAEFQARLRAQIRAHANSSSLVVQIGPYLFQPANRTLQHVSSGGMTRLTHKETEVLKYLHRYDGTAIGRQTLLREVWGYKDGADSYTVESHIYRLRRKIEADPARPRFLLNEQGGYMLMAQPPRPWPPIRAARELQLAS